MNLDHRLGDQDVEAAALFQAARSFRPSARGRRRALRALGLPIGLSLFGSGLAHAAYVLSSSLKGWGMVAGVVATVGAAGSVTYVVSTAPSTPSRVVSKQGPPARPSPTPKRPVPVAAASAPAGVLVPALSEVATADVPVVPPVAVPVAVPVPVRRLAMRPEPRALPSSLLARDPGQSPVGPSPAVAPSISGLVERPIEPLAPPPFRAPPGALPSMTAGPSGPSGPSGPPGPSSLNGELALVATAQARLRAGDAPGAFAALDRHVRLYPNGALAEEAELLRVRAFIAKGDALGAQKTGEAFLQRHPSSPLVARFRSLMDALGVPASP